MNTSVNLLTTHFHSSLSRTFKCGLPVSRNRANRYALNKRIISLSLALTLILFSQISFAVECADPDATDEIRIYFGNGMGNLPEDMDESQQKLQELVGTDQGRRSFGKSINTKEAHLTQLWQVSKQKLMEPKLFWKSVADPISAPSWFQYDLAKTLYSYADLSYAGDDELKIMVKNYLRDLNSGKKVVIVSHSQGNWYANTAYLYIRQHYPHYARSIGIVAVGTPASMVADSVNYTSNRLNATYTTNKFDYVIANVGSFARGIGKADALPGNMTYDQPDDLVNHSFVGTYLAGAGSQIKTHVYKTIDRLESPPIHEDCITQDEQETKVLTLRASDITAKSAVFKGKIMSGSNINYWWDYSTDFREATCNSLNKSSVGNGNTAQEKTHLQTGLISNTLYFYRFCGKGADGTDSGSLQSVRTKKFGSALVETGNVVNIGQTSARLTGRVLDGENIPTYFAYSDSLPVNCSIGNSIPQNGMNAGDSFQLDIENLTPQTTYYYRACGGDTDSVNQGSIHSFNTVRNLSCGNVYEGGSNGLSLHVADNPGYDKVRVHFEAYQIPDHLTIYPAHGSVMSTGDYVSGYWWVDFDLRGGFDFVVTGNNNTGTKWKLGIECS